MICSLSLVLGFIHLPIGNAIQPVGWFLEKGTDRITIDLVEAQSEPIVADLAPITSFERGSEAERVPESSLPPESNEPESDGLYAEGSRTPRAMKGLRVFEFAQQMPELIGGLGAYYIHIAYPQSAIEAGIEGRLVLSFVVDTLGHTREIRVVKSLHADCDSAAVQALRRTRFVPGRQNGEAVSVRMRLPVVFKLIPPAETENAASL